MSRSSDPSPPSGATRRFLLLGLAAAGVVARGLPGAAAAPASMPIAAREDMVGSLVEHVADGERTLLEIAREHNIGVPHISAVNPGIDPWTPRRGARILLPTAHLLPDAPREGIVINKADLRLYHFAKDGRLQHYAIGVGKEGFDTPSGTTRITRKRERPTWIPTKASIDEKPWLPRVFPPGPDNPLGDHAMDLGFPGSFVIHGTNKPFGVGRRVSHGCIRMYPEGIARLFPQIPLGTKATLVEQFVKVGWSRGELYVQVMPTFAQIDELEADYRMSPVPPPPDLESRVVAKAGPEFARVDWQAVAEAGARRLGVPVQVTRPAASGVVGEAEGYAVTVSESGDGAAAAAAVTPAVETARPLLPHGLY